MHRLVRLVPVLLVCGSLACMGWLAPMYDEHVPTRADLEGYTELYPRSVAVCAVTQFRRADGLASGSPGHAALYLHGACRDGSAPYPRLKTCEPADSRGGVGVSVSRWTKNVNWIATPGVDLFMNGGLRRGERLTEERAQATAERAIEIGMFGGVELHEYPSDAEQPSLYDFVQRHSLGTDFALRFGRSVFCSFMPVTEDMMADVVEYLNGLNREYAEGEADYDWSGYADNCVHTIHNALAAAGIWKPKSVRATKLRQLFNMAIPANEFVSLGQLGGRDSLEFSVVWEDPVKRRALLERGWLPTRHGALLQSASPIPVNDLFDTRPRFFVAENPLRRGTSKRGARLLNDARFTELDVNLAYWRERYRSLLERRPDPERFGLISDERRLAETRYGEYLEAQLADVERLIERFEQLHAEPAPAS